MHSLKSIRRSLGLAALALLVLTLAARAQQQPPPPPAAPPRQTPAVETEEVLRVTTELVQTDVSVFDKGGKFVDNLKPEQFELKLDGKPQPISFFERVIAGSLDEDAQLAAARGSSRKGSATAAPLDRGRAVVFFLDDLHLSPSSLVRTREMLRRFIDSQLRQNDQLVITTATNQLGFLSQLTDDRAVLRAAVARLNVREQKESVDSERPQINIVQAMAIEQGSPDVIDYFVTQTIKENPAFGVGNPDSARAQALEYVRRRANQLIDLSSSIVVRTLDSLHGVMRTFAAYPGRKLVYFVSDGFTVELRRSGTNEHLRRVTDAAVRAGAVVYTVDARGLGAQLADLPSADDNSSPDPTGRLTSAGLSMTNSSQEPLRTIADETGGRAIINTNTLEGGIAKALKDTSVYYLLAWKPERAENRGGKFRRIEVGVKGRPDLTVLVQRGFFSSPPPDAAAKRSAPPKKDDEVGNPTDAKAAAGREQAKELFAALRSPFPRSALPTSVTLNYLQMGVGKLILSTSVQVEIDATPATADGAAQTDRAEIIGAVYDDHGKVVNSFQRGVSITPKNAGGTSPATHRIALAFQSDVAPGLFQVRIASRDPKNHRTGSASQWIEIPDVGKGGFALSSVFLGVRPMPDAAPDAGAKTGGATPAADAPQVLVVPDRRFARATPLRFLIYAYNATLAGGKPDLAAQVQVFRDDQPVITTPLRKVNTEGFAELSRLPYAAEFSMSDVPAGRYVLRVTAIDRVAKVSASQSVNFIIE